jgi:hypothetical protein
MVCSLSNKHASFVFFRRDPSSPDGGYHSISLQTSSIRSPRFSHRTPLLSLDHPFISIDTLLWRVTRLRKGIPCQSSSVGIKPNYLAKLQWLLRNMTNTQKRNEYFIRKNREKKNTSKDALYVYLYIVLTSTLSRHRQIIIQPPSTRNDWKAWSGIET